MTWSLRRVERLNVAAFKKKKKGNNKKRRKRSSGGFTQRRAGCDLSLLQCQHCPASGLGAKPQQRPKDFQVKVNKGEPERALIRPVGSLEGKNVDVSSS